MQVSCFLFFSLMIHIVLGPEDFLLVYGLAGRGNGVVSLLVDIYFRFFSLV